MYLDEKRQGEVQSPSKGSMISWIVANKDPNETYYWLRKDGCACHQYGQAIGRPFDINDPNDGEMWSKLDLIARPYPFMNTSETFGNLLERLRATL